MDTVYEQFLKEEIEKYAPFYYAQFKCSILTGKADLKQHMEDVCQFDEAFYEDMFYQDDYFPEKVNDHEYMMYKQGLPLDVVSVKRESYQRELMQTMKKEFIERFLAYYDDEISQELMEAQNEHTQSKEEENYYIDRLYIGEEEDIGGVLSEKERLEYIEEERKRQERLEETITYLREVKSELEGMRIKETA